MATLTHRDHEPAVARRYDDVVVTDDYVEESAPVGPVARAVALVTSAALAIVGLVAAAQIDWSNGGFDAPSVQVLDMPFTPAVAVATALLGILAIGASAGRAGEGKIVMGAILAAVGVAILIADGRPVEAELVNRHGWLAIGVGVILMLAGLMSGRMGVRRTVQRDERMDLV